MDDRAGTGRQPACRRLLGPANPFAEFKRAEIEQSIPARFEKQVRRDPKRIAAKDEERGVTYEALNRAADRIAAAILARRGRGSEPVAVLFENGAPAITAIMGTLKAGKFYVPLEPSHPPARSLQILEDSQAVLIITDGRNAPAARELAGPAQQVIDIDRIDAETRTQEAVDISPDDAAYIYYTSGSTGKPKGVVDTHRNVLHNIMRYTNSLHIRADDRLTLLQSCGFSGAVSSLFGALLNGAAVCPFNLRREGVSGLASWIAREKITIYHSVPSLFRHVAAAGVDMPALRLIRLEGDRPAMRDVRLFRERFGDECVLVNGLGATECGIVRQFFIDRQTAFDGAAVPIGYAVEDMEVILLDDEGAVVEAGEIGEIAVRSRYLAKGYWRNPELTAAAFLSDPAGDGQRIYLTGDLARMLENGCLEYLGRKDFNLKIGGVRIDTAEVERAMLESDAVREAVVLTREDRPGEPRLVAYVVPQGTTAATVSALRRHLGRTLPLHMIPSAFVTVTQLPLSPNGKLDRKALGPPGPSRPALDAVFVAARTPAEEILAELWGEVLGINEVGIDDGFLELGGNSLLAAQVVSRVLDRFGVQLPLAALLETATVRDMTALIARRPSRPAAFEDPAAEGIRASAGAAGKSQVSPQHRIREGRAAREVTMSHGATPGGDHGTAMHLEAGELEHSIGSRFEVAANLHRERLACKFGRESLTYGELDGAANLLAGRLVEAAGEGNEPVAVLLEEGIATPVAMIAALKAGKIYVPLDGRYPERRLEYMLEDTEAAVIVTDAAHLPLARRLGGGGRRLLNMDEVAANLPAGPPALSVSADWIGSVLYTSGSTGEPKGVVTTHRHLLHTAATFTSMLRLDYTDRMSSVMSFAFAGGMKIVLAALLNGTAVFAGALDGLAELLIGEGITVAVASPSILNALVNTLGAGRTASKLRAVYVGGEPLHKADAARFVKLFGKDVALINSLAMSEAGIVTGYSVSDASEIDGDIVPVGCPVPGMETVVLDDRRKPLALGQVGEIAVRSPYLASGYWRKPELTAAVFPDGATGGGKRTYLTGDMGRMSGDGCLVHLGRRDFMLKIRGFRVEVAEIEKALLSHADVERAVVMRREDRPGDERLVAYVVPARRGGPTVSALRRHVAASVPEYMVPSIFVLLDELPLTPNGKVDRATLPAPDSARPEIESAYVAPRTPVEKALARMWAAVLGIDKVGINDDFMELGGHSLLAARVISRALEELGAEVPPSSFFQTPTVAGMALAITQRLAEKMEQEDITRMFKELDNPPDEPN